MAHAQQPPQASGSQSQPPSPKAVPAATAHGDPLNDPLLQDADEKDVPTDFFSHVSFEYDHQMLSSGADSERLRIEGEQTFGGNRLGIDTRFRSTSIFMEARSRMTGQAWET